MKLEGIKTSSFSYTNCHDNQANHVSIIIIITIFYSPYSETEKKKKIYRRL